MAELVIPIRLTADDLEAIASAVATKLQPNLDRLTQGEQAMSAELDALTAQVQAVQQVDQSAITLISMTTPPPARPRFTGQDHEPWSVHAEAERRWLYDAVEWLLLEFSRLSRGNDPPADGVKTRPGNVGKTDRAALAE